METEKNTNLSFNFAFVFIIGFTFAIFISSFIFVSPLTSLLILIIGLAIIIGEKIVERNISKEVLILSLIIISFALGALRYSVKDFHEVTIPSGSGVVVSEPEDKENYRRFVFKALNSEKALVNAPLYSPVQYGDRVEVRGKLEKPGIIKDEDIRRDFDYGKYLSKDDIYYTVSFAEVEIISSGHGHPIKTFLFKIKRSFVNKSKNIFSEPYASLLNGLLISGREALPKDILEEFRRAGVIHIVVLSGFNITLIANFLKTIFRSHAASIIGIILFVIMTGAGASIVRAAIMALIATSAKFFGREYSASRALMGAGFLMLIENPKILVFDPSFQLSFLATLGLIYVMPWMEKCLSRGVLTKWEKLRETLAQTLATQATVLPLLIYMSGDVSLVSLPANILILLTVPYTMLVGFAAVIISFISSILAWPFTYVSYLLLSWILFVAHTLGSLKFATIGISSFYFWIILLVYSAALAFVKLSSTFRQFRFVKKSST